MKYLNKLFYKVRTRAQYIIIKISIEINNILLYNVNTIVNR